MPEPELNLHPDAAAFLEELRTLKIPGDPRARYEFLCSKYAGPRVEAHTVTDLATPVRARLYEHGSGPMLVWFHGGRFISGSLETHDALCRRLAVAIRGKVLAIDYRLAPEHQFPAAFEDARTAAAFARTLHENPAAGGDSAGAALALACGLETTILAYPMLEPSCSTASHSRFRHGPGPSSEDMLAGWNQFLPLGAEFHLTTDHVRRALIISAEIDPLLDEGLALLAKLHSPEHLHLKGHIHGFLTYPARFTTIDTVIAGIASFLGRA